MRSSTDGSTVDVSDESLLLLGRMGRESCRDLLAVRYYKNRHRLCHRASPAIMTILDEWEANEAFFRGYLDAEISYRFGRVSFASYALKCIRFALANAVDSKLSKTKTMVAFSLDAPQIDERGEETSLCMADIVQNTSAEDPRVFLDYAESLEMLNKLPKTINPMSLKIASGVCDGYKVSEIARALGITEKQANYYFARYKDWAKKTLSKAGVICS